MDQYKQILTDGLWSRNPGLVQFLGICPLLAVSNTLVNGLALGAATTAVLILTNLLVSLLRGWIAPEIRLPVFVIIIASAVSGIGLVLEAWYFDLWLNLGLFVPLIVTNCVILARAESFASRQNPAAAILDGLANGLGFTVVLALLGAVREIIGSGTLFAGADMLFGAAADGLTVHLGWSNNGFILALLPPGAFLGLALLIAARNAIQQAAAAPTEQPTQLPQVADKP